ncbi:intermembrane transport protein PqiB [Bacterioplanoides sp.]|uniref:intermembrane transport protein PqiB n=1 Tax=Bacterioplanoides sp. TaxID=2066072 RepID=UPI003B00334B
MKMNRPEVEESGWSPVWLIPVVALLIGVWMVYSTMANQGPLIKVQFATAEGLEAGKTRIKTRSVDIGTVESVMLNPGLDGITVTARIDKTAEPLLTRDARLWVVRPRVGTTGVSGLGTLLSGAYIELDPGTAEAGARQFTGLEDVPLTSPGTPGLALKLFSDSSHSLTVADPVLYQGFRVGQVESASFDADMKQAVYQIFIDAPYDRLITTNTRFWNVAGIQLDASAEGVNVTTGSLASLLAGGITFDVPPDLPVGQKVDGSQPFHLHANQRSAFERRHQYRAEYLILLEDSVRGLTVGAPVEYRGIRIGSVAQINVKGVERSGNSELDKMIPVLIYLEPGRIGYGDSQQGLDAFRNDFVTWVADGLSAKLQTGNLLSGSQFVAINFHDDELPDFPDIYSGYSVIPTSQEGLEQISYKLEKLLDKVNGLPLEDTLQQANQVLAQLNATLQRVEQLGHHTNGLLADESTRRLPEQLSETLETMNQALSGVGPNSENYRQARQLMTELRAALGDLQPLLHELNNKPSALLFSEPRSEDIQPLAP